MPNIILTEYCNLRCPYCFASQMIEEAQDNNKNITMEQLEYILQWLKPSALAGNFQLGIIGGEPTLHPLFKELLLKINSFCETTDSRAILFTNGILLDKFLHLFNQNTSILINVNQLNDLNKLKLINSLDLINSLNWFEIQKATLGCNLFLEEKEYKYFWDIVDRYPNKIKLIRMSVTAPNNKALKQNKDEYYLLMKNIFLDFVKEAYKRNIELSYDCNQIPYCYFSDEEQKLLLKMGFEQYRSCDPVVDITPDFKATCCFGAYEPIECKYFDNLSHLIKYYKNKITLKIFCNNTGKCKDCDKMKYSQCQGGCLSFSTLVD